MSTAALVLGTPSDGTLERYLSELSATVDRLRALRGTFVPDLDVVLRDVIITACLMVACHTIGLVVDAVVPPRLHCR